MSRTFFILVALAAGMVKTANLDASEPRTQAMPVDEHGNACISQSAVQALRHAGTPDFSEKRYEFRNRCRVGIRIAIYEDNGSKRTHYIGPASASTASCNDNRACNAFTRWEIDYVY
ncbi:MAG TPA: hypothetical protein VNO50_04415, partial [Pyrinomonadaceae bacterium]|nr:hypothetical protein [Pyrinomonadaceae bacterium]